MAQIQEPLAPVATADGRSPTEEDGSASSDTRWNRASRIAFQKKAIPVLLQSLVSLGLLGGSVFVFVYLNASRPEPIPREATASLQIVETVVAKEGSQGIDFEVDGVVIPFRRIDVPVEVDGLVAKRSENCRIGRYVEKGDVLFEISEKDYDLEIRRLEEQLKQADASINELNLEIASRNRKIAHAEETLELKRDDLARQKQLVARLAASTSEHDASKLDELQARSNLQTETDQLKITESTRARLESERELAIVQLEGAQLDKQRCTVRSPISGVITQEPVEEGTFLQRGATVATVQDVSTMEIRCSLSMRQMNWLWTSNQDDLDGTETDDGNRPSEIYRIPQTPVTVKFKVDGTEYLWQGSLDYYDGAEVDRTTRMVACRVYVRDPQGQARNATGSDSGSTRRVSLMTGMFVTLQVHATPRATLIELPESALYPGNEVWSVVGPNESLKSKINADDQPTQNVSAPILASNSPDEDNFQYGVLRRISLRLAHAKDDMVFAYASEELQAGDRVIISPLASPVNDVAVKYRTQK